MFYKNDNGQLLKGNHVINKDYELVAKQPKPIIKGEIGKGELIQEGELQEIQLEAVSVDTWKNETITKASVVTAEKYEFVSADVKEIALPVKDWYWFESDDDAYLFFKLEKPVEVDQKNRARPILIK